MQSLKDGGLSGVIAADDQVYSPEVVQLEALESPVVFEGEGSDHA